MRAVPISSAVLLLLAGCATTPEPSQPVAFAYPDRWTASATAGQSDLYWLEDFEDPVLEALVDEGLRANYDLIAAAARFDQAAAEAAITGADRLPALGLSVDGSRRKFNSIGGLGVASTTSSRTNLGLNVSWEIDVWGKLRDRTAASLANVEASAEELEAARLSLAAQITKAWYNLAASEAQLRLSQTTAEAVRANLNTIQQRYERGLSTGLDLRLIRTQSAAADADIELRRRQRDAAARQLEILLGRYPANELAALEQLPALETGPPADLPATVLARRPDLRAAERRLVAADKTLEASKKEFLPTLSLTGSAGTSSDEFADLLDRNFSVWSIAGSLTQPIFQGGRIKAGVQRSEALREQAIANYQRAALQAFLEVETALAAERYLANETMRRQIASDESAAAEALSWDQYAKGIVDIIVPLSSQRTAATDRSLLVAVRNEYLQNRVDLYLALGGPFREPEPPQEEPQS